MFHTDGKDISEEVIKQLFGEYYEKLCLYAEGIVRDHAAAEDIVEELFIYLWINSDNVRITPGFKTYLYRSVHNNCIKHITRNQTSNHTQISENEKEIFESSSHHLPLNIDMTTEIENKAEEILNSLPDRCRQIFIMSRYENKSYSRISDELDVSISTIKTQMARALVKFKEGLKKFFD